MTATLEQDVETVVSAISARKTDTRVIIAIAGPPGAGKSTLAEAVTLELNRDDPGNAALVPMDGFHLDNRILTARDLLPRKGAPETFDSLGFLHLIRRVRDGSETIHYPVFDRDRDLAIAGAATLTAETDIIVVEGNYLLLKSEPWSDLKPCFDLSIMIAPPIDILRERLVQRWLDQGLSPEAATERAERNDIANARTVLAQSTTADIQLQN